MSKIINYANYCERAFGDWDDQFNPGRHARKIEEVHEPFNLGKGRVHAKMHSKIKGSIGLAEVLAAYRGDGNFQIPPDGPNARGAGNFILNVAAYRGNLRHVQILVEHGALVNCVDDMGNTPLHDAVESGTLEVVEYLLSNGANVAAKNEFGQTPLDSAIARGHKKIAASLRRAKKF